MISDLRRRFARDRDSQRPAHLELGRRGEQAAAEYLESSEGYRLVALNFLVPLGRGLRGQKLAAEIDIIAYDGDTLVFVEVKTRTSDDLISPARAVGLRKQRQIARASRRYRQLMKVWHEPHRYDVLTVVTDRDGDRIELLRGYFSDADFGRKRFFQDR